VTHQSAGQASALPAWAEMSDLDKGAALLHLHKRDWEGAGYAVENYPARYFEHPALTALSERDACRHAVSVKDDAERAGALRGDEHQRLYDLALDHELKNSQQAREGITGMHWDNLGHGGAA
jgi:hypothetical protein